MPLFERLGGNAGVSKVVEMLRQELDRVAIAAEAKNELLHRLAPIKRDIVAAG
jgi:hypothetical protein